MLTSILVIVSIALAVRSAPTSSQCSIDSGVSHTFYGWPDNDPPSAATAYNCEGRNYIAGGTGTYDDPVTFASAPSEFTQCEIIFDPYLQKYLRFEDSCAACTTDWADGQGFMHIDVWSGSNTGSGGQSQTDCEIAMTPAPKSQSIIRNPSPSLSVDSKFLLLRSVEPGISLLTSPSAKPIYANGACIGYYYNYDATSSCSS